VRGQSWWPPCLAVGLVAALSLWGWSLHPEYAGRWLARMLVLPLMLAVVAWRISPAGRRTGEERRILDWHRIVFTAVGVIVSLDLTAQLCISTGVVSPDWREPLVRLEGLLWGAGFAVWGNRLPTLASPWALEEEPFDWQRVHRFVGRLALVAGIAVVLVWLVFPLSQARSLMTWIVGVALLAAVARKLGSLIASSNEPSVSGRVR